MDLSPYEDLLRIPEDSGFVTAAYERILGREPDLAGAWRFMMGLRLVPWYGRRRVLRSLLTSDEYRRVIAGGDADRAPDEVRYADLLAIEDPERFVREVFRRIVCRRVEQAEVDEHAGALRDQAYHSRRSFVRSMLASEEVREFHALARRPRMAVPFSISDSRPEPGRDYPRVTICSLFRDSEGYLDRLRMMTDALAYPRDRLRFRFMEGGSADGTRRRLEAWAAEDARIRVHSEPQSPPHRESSVAARFPGLAVLSNHLLEAALPGSDFVLWIESDLMYPSDLLLKLAAADKPLISPMVYFENTGLFYDTWAFRRGSDPALPGPHRAVGCFQMRPPHHPCLRGSGPAEVDSTGSALLIARRVLEAGARFTPDENIVGLCRSARRLGFAVWVDPAVTVYHPLLWSPPPEPADPPGGGGPDAR